MVASIYFHLPFCSKKCPYCHFFVLKEDDSQKKALEKALACEFAQKKPLLQGKEILSVYFGGGTPSKMPLHFYQTWLDKLSKELQLSSNCEITIEVNPEDVTKELISNYRCVGMNRISMGVQTFDDPLLKSLGRTHTAKQAMDATSTIHSYIDNLTIDLMYDLPRQTLSSWKQTIDVATKLPIQHLSLYNLGFEQGSAFYRKKNTLLPLLPKETDSLQMLEYAIEQLEKAQLKRYEISAFSHVNKESVHNTGYWKGRPFLGLGPSAFSYWGGKRFQNVCNLKKYCDLIDQKQSPVDFSEKLPRSRRTLELFTIGIRMLTGIDINEFSQKAGTLSKQTLKTLEELKELGLLSFNHKKAQLTKKGTFFYDTVAEKLL